MSFKKIFSDRIYNLSKISTQTLTKCRISSSPAQTRIPPSSNQSNIAPDPGDNGIFRRFLHRRSIFSPEIRSLPPIGENLKEKLKAIGIAQDRIRLDGLTPPPMGGSTAIKSGLTVEESRKFLRVAQLETVKSKLKMIQRSWISYSEFIRICEEACSDTDQGRDFAKTLDESGNVIVLGNVVFLRPEEVIFSSACLRSLLYCWR